MHHGVRLTIVAVAVLALAVGPLAADAGQPPAALASAEGAQVDAGSVAAQANNTTVRHRNPDEVDEDGDLDEVQAWLAGRLGERLTESSLELSQGQYDAARSLVGEEYRRELGKYVDVAGDTEEERDDRAGEAFDRTGDRQESFADGVEEYRETREEYEAATDAGEEARARELARELDRLADDVNETGRNLTDGYAVIGNETGADLTAASATVEEVRTNVTEQQASIRAAEFVGTELVAAADRDRASFAEPATVTGRLTAANGTPLADRTVVLEAGGRAVGTATTDAAGEGTIEFRPTAVPIGNTTLTLRYVPADASVYLESTDTVAVDVEQADATVTLSEHTERAGYGESVAASGTVAVDGVGAPGVPLVVAVDGVQVGTVETGDGGRFSFDGALPAGATPGDRELRVAQPAADLALAAANASAPLTVTSTATAVTLDATAGEGRTVEVEGRLETADGRSIGDRTVALSLNGTAATTVATGPDGRFDASLSVPTAVVGAGENASLVVAAAFDGAGTNLESSAAEATVTVEAAADSQGSDGPLGGAGVLDGGVPTWAWLALAAVLALAVGAAVLFRRRGAAPDDDEPVSDPAPSTGRADPEPAGPSPLDVAREHLREGRPEQAVAAGYGAARDRLGEALGVAAPRTHREFVRACREAGLDAERLDALRRLTDLFERAAFTPDPVSEADAAAAVDTADELAAPAGRAARAGDD